MNFYSVAEDGRINNWVLMQNDLAVTTIITLFLAKDEVFGPDGTKLKTKGRFYVLILIFATADVEQVVHRV